MQKVTDEYIKKIDSIFKEKEKVSVTIAKLCDYDKAMIILTIEMVLLLFKQILRWKFLLVILSMSFLQLQEWVLVGTIHVYVARLELRYSFQPTHFCLFSSPFSFGLEGRGV